MSSVSCAVYSVEQSWPTAVHTSNCSPPQVYKSQLARLTEGWSGKIDEFERVNRGLESSLARLREENQRLGLQVGRIDDDYLLAVHYNHYSSSPNLLPNALQRKLV